MGCNMASYYEIQRKYNNSYYLHFTFYRSTRKDVGLFIVIILIRRSLLVDQTILKVLPVAKFVTTLFRL